MLTVWLPLSVVMSQYIMWVFCLLSSFNFLEFQMSLVIWGMYTVWPPLSWTVVRSQCTMSVSVCFHLSTSWNSKWASDLRDVHCSGFYFERREWAEWTQCDIVQKVNTCNYSLLPTTTIFLMIDKSLYPPTTLQLPVTQCVSGSCTCNIYSVSVTAMFLLPAIK